VFRVLTTRRFFGAVPKLFFGVDLGWWFQTSSCRNWACTTNPATSRQMWSVGRITAPSVVLCPKGTIQVKNIGSDSIRKRTTMRSTGLNLRRLNRDRHPMINLRRVCRALATTLRPRSQDRSYVHEGSGITTSLYPLPLATSSDLVELSSGRMIEKKLH